MAHPLTGKLVIAMASNYIYTGTLEAVEIDRILLADPWIVYETGAWSDAKWKDAQRLPTDRLYIERSSVESLFEVKRDKKQ